MSNHQQSITKSQMPNAKSQQPATILLHTCCAPCLTYPLSQLQKRFQVTAYFYNPNIQPDNEYSERLAETQKFCQTKNINLKIADYQTKDFCAIIRGLEQEPEGGQRCYKCYQLRLAATAKFAKLHNYDCFTTVLSVSPHKNATWLNLLGTILSQKYQVKYLRADFKKNNGFLTSVKLSRQYQLKRQNYCGCLFSRRPTQNSPALPTN